MRDHISLSFFAKEVILLYLIILDTPSYSFFLYIEKINFLVGESFPLSRSTKAPGLNSRPAEAGSGFSAHPLRLGATESILRWSDSA